MSTTPVFYRTPRNLSSTSRYVLWWTLRLSIVFLAPHKGPSLYNLQQDPFFLVVDQERIWPWKSGEYHPKVFLFIRKGPQGSTLTYSVRSYVFRRCQMRFCKKKQPIFPEIVDFSYYRYMPLKLPQNCFNLSLFHSSTHHQR